MGRGRDSNSKATLFQPYETELTPRLEWFVDGDCQRGKADRGLGAKVPDREFVVHKLHQDLYLPYPYSSSRWVFLLHSLHSSPFKSLRKMFSLRSLARRSLATSSISAPLRTQSTAQIVRSYSVAFYGRTHPILRSSPTALPSLQRRWASDSAEVAETQQEPEADGAVESTEKSSSQGVKQGGEHHSQTIFVGNLAWQTTEEHLQEMFGSVGKVQSATIAIDRKGMPRGFGWVRYTTVEESNAAAEQLQGLLLNGRNVRIAPALSESSTSTSRSQMKRPPTTAALAARPPQPPSEVLFIGNLSYEMTDVDLNNLFQPIKNLRNVRVAIDRRTGQPRGFAHADFVDVESATRAKELLSTKSIYGRQLRVDFSTSYANKQETGEDAGVGADAGADAYRN